MRAERGFWLADQLAKVIMVAVLAAVGGYLAWEHLTAPPSGRDELRRANPGWAVEEPRHIGLSLTDAKGPELVINGDDAGPLRLERQDCAQFTAALPAWVRLPPGQTIGCLRMGDAAPFVQVLNHRTAMPVPELWSRHFEPLLDELELPYGGGSSSSRKYYTMSYGVDPAHGTTGPRVGLMAFTTGDGSLLVVTLRPPDTR